MPRAAAEDASDEVNVGITLCSTKKILRRSAVENAFHEFRDCAPLGSEISRRVVLGAADGTSCCTWLPPRGCSLSPCTLPPATWCSMCWAGPSVANLTTRTTPPGAHGTPRSAQEASDVLRRCRQRGRRRHPHSTQAERATHVCLARLVVVVDEMRSPPGRLPQAVLMISCSTKLPNAVA